MNLRNVAIIAHVDHGKTTLVDKLLQQSGTYRDNERVVERAMDSNDLERERGITILAKAASVQWKDTRINIVDEVERILNMVDGALVLVDAAEGPLPQTKFVVSKALKVGLKPIVVINKVDRPDARPTEVINEVFDLFAALDASEEQLDFPILYGSAKQGWMADSPEGPKDAGMQPLFDLILRHVAPPTVEEGPFRMIGTILEANPYLGRIITGRITSGSIKPNQAVKVLGGDGKLIESGRITKILAFRGIERTPLDEAEAGDIIAIAGLSKGTVADTFCDPSVETPLTAQPIDPPTVSMSFIVNNSPLAGTEGDKVTSRMIRDRLLREAEGNVALRVVEATDKDAMEVSGRGELQLAILIETMRREGFELSVSRPRVVLQKDEATGQWQEPIEEVVIDVDEEHSGVVVQKMSERKAEMIEMRPSGGHYRHPRHRDHEPPVPRLCQLQGRNPGPPQRRPDFQRSGRGGRLRHVQAGRPRPDDDRARLQGLQGHDRRRAYPRQRPRDQHPQGQAAHQHPHHLQGRSGAPDAADPDDLGKGAGLYRGRRTGRSDPEVDPPAQEVFGRQRPQARGKVQGSGGVSQICHAPQMRASSTQRPVGLIVTISGILHHPPQCAIAHKAGDDGYA